MNHPARRGIHAFFAPKPAAPLAITEPDPVSSKEAAESTSDVEFIEEPQSSSDMAIEQDDTNSLGSDVPARQGPPERATYACGGYMPDDYLLTVKNYPFVRHAVPGTSLPWTVSISLGTLRLHALELGGAKGCSKDVSLAGDMCTACGDLEYNPKLKGRCSSASIRASTAFAA